MNSLKRFVLLLTTLFCLLPVSLRAEVWTPETLPMVHLQDSLRFVCNPDGVLSPSAVQATDALLAQLKQAKGVETVVVVVKRLRNGDAYQFGMDLSRKYGIGDKRQRSGLIIILSTEDRKYQFLTGNGLEGTLPDGLCYRIQQTAMVPALKRGNWDEAIYNSVKAVHEVIMKDDGLKRSHTRKKDGNGLLGLSLGAALFIFLLIIFRSSEKVRHTCPQCRHKGSFRKESSRRLRKGHQWYTQSTWRCAHCGHTEIREEDDTPSDGSHGGMFIPPIFMSGGRGFGSGGDGFQGGSFGGGSFGGGGSGDSF